MKYMAWIVMALLIQAILANSTPPKEVVEEEVLPKESPDESQSMFDGVCCSSGYAYARSANGKWVKLEAIKVLEETFDPCELFEIDCEEASTQTTLGPAEEITDYPDYPNYEQSISGVRCTGGLTMSPNGGCIETVTIEVDYKIDLCGIFGLC